LLDEAEKKLLEAYEAKNDHGIWFYPLVWADDLLSRAFAEGKIAVAVSHQTLVRAIVDFRNHLYTMKSYDLVSFPPLYTQVATIFVYGYFLFTIFGHQWLDPTKDDFNKYRVDFYFPIL
ncbi:unnamed protein product, partial [Cyprideis torosa]